MNTTKPDFHFLCHVYFFKIRDFFFPRITILKEAKILPVFRVLDYGCGPGSYIMPLARIVGTGGMVYAVDIHPLAIKKVKDIVAAKKLENVEVICCDGKIDVPNESIDIVLLYDVFHALKEPEAVLRELHRVLKPGGILSCLDHRKAQDEMERELAKAGLFALLKKGRKTYTFQKINI